MNGAVFFVQEDAGGNNESVRETAAIQIFGRVGNVVVSAEADLHGSTGSGGTVGTVGAGSSPAGFEIPNSI